MPRARMSAEEFARLTPWIGVDLDGTLALYHGWIDDDDFRIGDPVRPMVERVRAWLAEGRDVRIFTARAAHMGEKEERSIQAWCEKYIGVVLPITCTKDHAMKELWDDRAVAVERNTGRAVAFNTRHGGGYRCNECGSEAFGLDGAELSRKSDEG